MRTLAPAGRLDIDSTGLLVLTQDGRVAKQLIGGHSDVDKEYLVRVKFGEHEVDIEPHFPPESLDSRSTTCRSKQRRSVGKNGEQLRFVLREGKKRQIRRMCELVGLEVVGLKRIRMGSRGRSAPCRRASGVIWARTKRSKNSFAAFSARFKNVAEKTTKLLPIDANGTLPIASIFFG